MPFCAVLAEAPGWLLLLFFQLEEGALGGVSAFSFSTMTLTFPRIEVISSKLMCYLIYFIPITLFQTFGRKKDHIFLDLILVRISLITPLLQSISCHNFKTLSLISRALFIYSALLWNDGYSIFRLKLSLQSQQLFFWWQLVLWVILTYIQQINIFLKFVKVFHMF